MPAGNRLLPSGGGDDAAQYLGVSSNSTWAVFAVSREVMPWLVVVAKATSRVRQVRWVYTAHTRRSCWTRWRTLLAASQAAKELGRRELVRACHQTHSGGHQMIQKRAEEMQGGSADA